MFFKNLFPSVGMQSKLVQIEKESPIENNVPDDESIIKMMLQEEERKA